MLAALTVDAGRPVPAEIVVDRVWRDSSLDRMRHTLHVYIARIRRTLDEISTDEFPVRLVRRSGGYLLEVDPDCVDIHRFRRLVDQARDCGSQDGQRAALLRQALNLWSGTPLADLSGEWAAQVRQGWQHQRLDVVVAWAQAELRLGRPGAELQNLHQALLRGSLDQPPVAPPPVEVAMSAVPAHLPMDVSGFTGRDSELARLDSILASTGEQPTAVAIAAVSGTAGVARPHWRCGGPTAWPISSPTASCT